MALHPFKFFVATGECSQSPEIHIWNIVNTAPFKIIKTYHQNGILHLAFSRDGSLLLSVGADSQYSIQVTNWKSEDIVAMRNSGQYQIFNAMFNPYNKYEFVTCGLKNITIWDI